MLMTEEWLEIVSVVNWRLELMLVTDEKPERVMVTKERSGADAGDSWYSLADIGGGNMISAGAGGWWDREKGQSWDKQKGQIACCPQLAIQDFIVIFYKYSISRKKLFHFGQYKMNSSIF